MAWERKQLELSMPNDPLREFAAHMRGANPKAARNLEILVTRCGRGGQGVEMEAMARAG
jgi:hypothetical protein